MGGFAWVTLATNDSYSLGALVLAHSLRRVGSKHDLAVLITPGVTQPMREKLSAVFSLVQEVNVLDSRDEANLALLARPELGITFTKLHCWRLTQYDKCVFVDADTLVVRNCDELFEREELSAAPDVGWPDCFNSGVFVFTPSQQTFASLTAFAASKGSFDGGDQGLLNLFFSDWAHKDISKHLPFIYNMCSTATYSYLPAYKQFGEDVRIIHFIGSTKPWLQYFDTVTGQVQPAPGTNHLQPLLQLWWNIFCENVHPELSPVMASTTLAPNWHDILVPTAPEPINTRHHVFHDSTDQTCDEIDTVEPDFSEFQDPWENYTEPTYTSDQSNCDIYNQAYETQFHSHNEYVHEIRGQSDSYIEHHQVYHHAPVHNQTCQVENQSHYHPPAVSIQSHQPEQHRHHHENPPVVNITNHNPSHNHEHNNYVPPTNFQSSQSQSQNDHYHPPAPSTSFHSNQSQHQNHHYSPPPVNFQSNQTETQSHQQNYPRYEEPARSEIVQNHHQHHEDHSYNVIHEPVHTHRQHNEHNEPSPHNSYNHLPDRLIELTNSQIDRNTLSSHTQQPCTESASITTQINQTSTGEIENSDSGIAGALAQLTLGEARSPEQVALEEHMRKYGWEQGQIDYMGRDSFDNIWKKICTTLDAAPEPIREKSPSKEKTPPKEADSASLSTSETAATTATVKEAAAAEEAVQQKPDVITESQPEKLIQEFVSEVTLKPEQQKTQSTEQTATESTPTQVPQQEAKEPPSTPTAEQPSSEKPAEVLRLTAAPPVLSLPSSPPVLSLTSSPPVLSIKEAGEKIQELKTPPTESKAEEKAEKVKETVIPLGFASPTTFESTTSLDLSAPEATSQPPESTAVSAPELAPVPAPQPIPEPIPQPPSGQSVPDSPVPIQVAESVLEADIKESVSEDIKPVTEEAISSISAPVQESVSAVVETLEPAAPALPPPPLEASLTPQANGTGGFDSDVKSDEDAPVLSAAAGVQPVAAEPPAEAEFLPFQSGPAQASVPVPEPPKAEEPLQSEPAQASVPVPAPPKPEEPPVVTAATPVAKTTETVPEAAPEAPASAPKPAPTEEKVQKAPEPVPQSTPVAPSSPQPVAEPAPPVLAKEKVSQPTLQPEEPKTDVPEEFEEAQEESTSESTRSEQLPIPGTPTVIEATPPTSPQFEVAEGQGEESKVSKKTTKKVIKKTGSEDKTEGSETEDGKKATKKVAKKVIKKPKEGQEDGAEGSSSVDKTKKVVKVTKKTTKTGETLQTDSSVPETPPPPSPDVPVPPKRKGKPGTAKTTSKKPDSEQ